MRIVAVTTCFPTAVTPTDGITVERDITAIAAHPDVTQVDVVHLVPPRRDDGLRATTRNGLRVLRQPLSAWSPIGVLAAARALGPLLRGADVVHTMGFSSLLPFVLGRPEVPWVHTEHWSGIGDPSSLPLSQRALLPLVAPLLGRPDVVTAGSQFLAEPIRAHRPGLDTRVVPRIVTPVATPPERPMRPRVPMRLVSVGELVESTDPVLAVETVAELRRRGVDTELTWVGDGVLRRTVQRRARKLDIGWRVRLPGTQSAEGLSAALAASDLFFLPARGDGVGVFAAEALAHGRPVVVGARGGHGEYVDPGVGELVAHQDPVAYADAIESTEFRTRHLSATDIAATIGDRFSAERVATGYRQAYHDAVRVARSGARPH